MLKENLIMLRNIHGFTQEEIAEKIGISRQAYAKWENGATVPDIEKCMSLAEVYGVTIDYYTVHIPVDIIRTAFPAQWPRYKHTSKAVLKKQLYFYRLYCFIQDHISSSLS